MSRRKRSWEEQKQYHINWKVAHREDYLRIQRESKKRRGYSKLRDPLKDKARSKLRNEVAAGRIVKPKSCPRCKREVVLHAHHEDYSKPLDVEWLCSICHGERHTNVRQARAVLKEVAE